MEPKMLRTECRECMSWDFRKLMCLRVSHGMACLWGPQGSAGPADSGVYEKIANNYNTKQSNPKDIVGTRKAPRSTVSAAVMAEVGVAMLEGALKYGRHNYRAVGVRSSVYYDATNRHLDAWWDAGEDIDPASGLHHVTKAIAGLMVLRDAMLNGKCEDDRPPSVPEFYEELNAKAAALVDRYAHVAPRHYTIADSSLAKAGLDDPVESVTFGPLRHEPEEETRI